MTTGRVDSGKKNSSIPVEGRPNKALSRGQRGISFGNLTATNRNGDVVVVVIVGDKFLGEELEVRLAAISTTAARTEVLTAGNEASGLIIAGTKAVGE